MIPGKDESTVQTGFPEAEAFYLLTENVPFFPLSCSTRQSSL